MNKSPLHSITKLAQARITELTKELWEHFGSCFRGFTHDQSFPQAEISTLTDSPGIIELFCDKKLTPNYHDSNGRIMPPGIYTTAMLMESYGEYALTQHIAHNQIDATEMIHILEHDPGIHHLYTFSFKVSSAQLNNLLINKLGYIKEFMSRYKYEAESLIKQAQRKEERFFYPELNKLATNCKNKLQLTIQQKSCLYFLVKGLSAKEIGKHMNISPRTVEIHLLRLKEKLGCRTKSELITKAIEKRLIQINGL